MNRPMTDRELVTEVYRRRPRAVFMKAPPAREAGSCRVCGAAARVPGARGPVPHLCDRCGHRRRTVVEPTYETAAIIRPSRERAE